MAFRVCLNWPKQHNYRKLELVALGVDYFWQSHSICSVAEVSSYVGRAYWQRPLADCRAQRALGFGSNRRILGGAGVWHVVCARWQVTGRRVPCFQNPLKNRS